MDAPRRLWRLLTVESSALAHAGLALLIMGAVALALAVLAGLLGRATSATMLHWAAAAAATLWYWGREQRDFENLRPQDPAPAWPWRWHRKSRLDLLGPAAATFAAALLVEAVS